jgi:uncharacterized protein YbaR (Trm112 family)
MIDPELLSLLCCPETHQELHPANAELLEQLNRRISARSLQNRSGNVVSEILVEGLLRKDGKVLYPVRNSIPVMLVEEGITLG